MTNSKRDKFIAAGLCARCGKKPPSNLTKLCEGCRDYQKQYAANQWKSEHGRKKRQCQLKNWQKSNPDKVRERAKLDYHKARQKVFDHYGRICKCCGDNHHEFLTIDHINNDGNKDRKNGQYSTNFYKTIIARQFPNDLQTLCWNCNLAKSIYGICPHKMENNE